VGHCSNAAGLNAAAVDEEVWDAISQPAACLYAGGRVITLVRQGQVKSPIVNGSRQQLLNR
jgi:hypothetical protein